MPAIVGSATQLKVKEVEALPPIAGKARSYRWINKTPECINLETAIDRLLPIETPYLFEGYCGSMLHQMGDHATHPIARFASPLALLLRLAWNGHAALSRLARRPAKRTLGYVQSPFLG
jgi:hypothetical protein